MFYLSVWVWNQKFVIYWINLQRQILVDNVLLVYFCHENIFLNWWLLHLLEIRSDSLTKKYPACKVSCEIEFLHLGRIALVSWQVHRHVPSKDLCLKDFKTFYSVFFALAFSKLSSKSSFKSFGLAIIHKKLAQFPHSQNAFFIFILS